MDWKPLYRMQERLDQYIERQHQIEKGSKTDEKILALLVEVGELANETRCFKFWSTKGPSEKKVILEEYVDGIHFLLSLGLDLGYSYRSTPVSKKTSQTSVFMEVYHFIEEFKQEKEKETYQSLVHAYLQLGETLGISEGELIEAYKEKNEINFKRQDEGY